MGFRYRHGDRPLDGYTIKRGVGHGGFGEVYYAVSDGGREVALKTVIQNHEVELRGVQHCINLKSPHLVSIFDVKTTEDSTPFVIMEYVAGPNLRDILRENPNGLGNEKAAYLLREIAKGLAYLHERGIVHRDLKPENLFYEDGYVKIGDYGLSKYISVSRQSGQTMSVGTVHYMAPEIGSGIYSRGIDIYALGVLLYEFLTGTVPFTGDSFGEILMKHLTGEPDLEPVDPVFRPVILKALAKKPEDRYATVEEMVADLFRSGDIDRSVSLFNPASLSVAAKRAAEAPPEIPPPIVPPVLPRGTPTLNSPTEAAQTPRAGAAGGAKRAHNPYRDTPNKGDAPAPKLRTSGWRTSLQYSHREAAALDPLLLPARMGRAVLTAGGLSILFGAMAGEFAYMFAFFFCMASVTAGVLASELILADRFQIDSAFGRRFGAGMLVLLPMLLGASVFEPRMRDEELLGASLSVLLTVLILDWPWRMNPNREGRTSIESAIYAGVTGFFCSMFTGMELGGLLAGTFFGVSLAVNSFMPLVPKARRRARQVEQDQELAQRLASRETAEVPPRNSPAGPGLMDRVADAGERVAEAGGRVADAGTAFAARTRERLSEGLTQAQFPPSQLAQVFWGFVAALFIAGGLSCLAILRLEYPTSLDERQLLVGFGIGLLAFSSFPIYRSIFARSPTIWGRAVRPFFLSVSASGTLAFGALLLLGRILARETRYANSSWVEEFMAVCAVVSAISATLTLFLLGYDRLARNSYFPNPTSHLPRPFRPVGGIARFAQLFIGAVCTSAAGAFAIVALINPGFDSTDQLGFFAVSVSGACLGGYFLHQGLRRMRGTLWLGTLRPFFATVGIAAFLTCGLCLSWPDGDWHNDERMLLVIAMIFGGVFAVFAFLVRGQPVDTPPDIQKAIHDSARKSAANQHVKRAWSGFGLLGWLLGLTSLFLAAASRALLPGEYIELANGQMLLYQMTDVFFGFGILSCGAGSVASLIARSNAGTSHLVRGIVGQVAFVLACAAFLASAGQVELGPGGSIVLNGHWDELINCSILGFGGSFIGTVAMIWPYRGPQAAAEPSEGSSPAAAEVGASHT